MQTVDLVTGPVAFVGALDLDISPSGIGPRRLPAWTRPQIPDAFMDAMIAMTSGVRLAFATDSTTIEIDVEVTSFRYVDRPTRRQVFQLVVDGVPVVDVAADTVAHFVLDPFNPADVGFEPGGPTTVRFDLAADQPSGVGPSGVGTGGVGPGGVKQCEVWLPHGATLRVAAFRIDDGATIVASEPTARRRWLHYGSSISHCLEADVPLGTWPAVAARAGAVNLHSLGMGGQCQLDPFVARTIRDVECDIISVKIGINVVNADSMRERTFTPAVHGLLDTIRDGHPQTPLLVVSPIFCPSAEDRPGPTLMTASGRFETRDRAEWLAQGALTLRRIREILAAVVDGRRGAGDNNLHYLDGLELFGAADAADLPDDLHPNPAGYARMGERFASLAFGPGGPLAG